ncbi:hypothetical protein D3C86_1968320 [compost metagenome]
MHLAAQMPHIGISAGLAEQQIGPEPRLVVTNLIIQRDGRIYTTGTKTLAQRRPEQRRRLLDRRRAGIHGKTGERHRENSGKAIQKPMQYIDLKCNSISSLKGCLP